MRSTVKELVERKLRRLQARYDLGRERRVIKDTVTLRDWAGGQEFLTAEEFRQLSVANGGLEKAFRKLYKEVVKQHSLLQPALVLSGRPAVPHVVFHASK